MKKRQILINKTSEKVHCEFMEQLIKNCYFDASTGEFYCLKCHNVIHFDFSRHYAFCKVHGMLS